MKGVYLQNFAADAHRRIESVDEPIEQAGVETASQGVAGVFGLRDGAAKVDARQWRVSIAQCEAQSRLVHLQQRSHCINSPNQLSFCPSMFEMDFVFHCTVVSSFDTELVFIRIISFCFSGNLSYRYWILIFKEVVMN